MKFLCSILVCCFGVTCAYAEKDTNKFGKITEEEVRMNSYAADTSAVAVVLYEKGDVYYQVTKDFEVYSDIYVKIKILKSSGTDYANVIVGYKDYGLGQREDVQSIDGFSYNYVNGKVEKTRLQKDFIFTENIKGKLFQKKFTLPNVKAGTLIEYKYTIKSDFDGQIRPWRFQREIPVCRSIYDVSVPEYYRFNMNLRGYNTIETVKEPINQTFIIQGGTFSCSGQRILLQTRDLPAMKNEKYVAYLNDYLSSVSFEISGFQIPGYVYKSYSYTWEDVEKQLMDDAEFGGNLKRSGLLKEEVAAIKALALSDKEKAKAIYDLVKAKVKWNEESAIYSSNVKKSLKDGVGSSADINFILINTLKDAGYDAYPIVMSSKDAGRLPRTNPSISGINYFVVGVEFPDETIYMDATRKYAPINVLHANYLVDMARSFRGVESHKSDWVDLSHINNNLDRIITFMTFGNNKLIVNITRSQNNQLAYEMRNAYKKYKNQDDWVEHLQNEYGVSIDNYQIEGIDSLYKPVIEKFTYSKPVSLTDPKLYVNLLTLFQEKSNPFTAEKRELPVEFTYPYTVKNTISIMIPSDFVTEALPKSERTSINDQDAQFSYIVQPGENTVQMISSFALNKILYSGTEYSYLKDFWSHVVTKNNEQIVLKRTN